MKKAFTSALALLTLLVMGVTANEAVADNGSSRHVVDASQIQDRIDQQSDQEAASREAIQLMLQRPEVRDLAGKAGLDITRASAAASVLSGAELEVLSAQAAEINAGIGGTSTVVLSTTAIIIILLIIILVAN